MECESCLRWIVGWKVWYMCIGKLICNNTYGLTELLPSEDAARAFQLSGIYRGIGTGCVTRMDGRNIRRTKTKVSILHKLNLLVGVIACCSAGFICKLDFLVTTIRFPIPAMPTFYCLLRVIGSLKLV